MQTKERITITVDADLLKRIDAVAADREESRSAVMERMMKNEISDEEKFVKSMANPLVREMTLSLVESPKLMRMLATLVGEKWTEEEEKNARERVPVIRAMGKRKQAEQSRGGPAIKPV